MSSRVDVEKPNKRNVEYLLRRELGINEYYHEPEYEKIQEQINEMESVHEALLKKNKKYIALLRKQNALKRKYQMWSKGWREQVANVRREYYAKGLTPDVLKKVEKLVDNYNKRSV